MTTRRHTIIAPFEPGAGERSIEGLRKALQRIERDSGAFRAAGASGGFRRVTDADLGEDSPEPSAGSAG